MNCFIWTEIYNCGKIGKIALESFTKYHPNTGVNVLGTPEDFKWITPHKNINFCNTENDKEIINGFKQGHLGTAILWTKLIQSKNLPKYFIHLDSDIIFRGEIISQLLNAFKNDTDLIGAIRNYKNNLCNVDNVRHLPDVCATGLFGFNRDKITNYPKDILVQMVRGTYNPLNHPTLDFFDPVMFDMLKNGAKISFLNFDEVGGCNNLGSRDNKYKDYNNMNTKFKIEFGSHLSHFSGVGSGMNFWNNKNVDVPKSYIDYCIDRYLLFCWIFYDEKLDPNFNYEQYRILKEINWF